jgi:hypothetical protein
MCEVALLNGVGLEKALDINIRYDGNAAILPVRVAEWLGVTHRDEMSGDRRAYAPRVLFQGEWEDLTSLNDRKLLSFNQIADAIEASWLTHKGEETGSGE